MQVQTVNNIQTDKKPEALKQSEIRNDEKNCKICMELDIDCVFVDCGHMVSCMQCASKFLICPICRKKIKQKLKIFR